MQYSKHYPYIEHYYTPTTGQGLIQASTIHGQQDQDLALSGLGCCYYYQLLFACSVVSSWHSA